MYLYVLFGQRHNSYPGENAPEALEVVDEYTFDANTDWIYEKRDAVNRREYPKVEIIKIKVSGEAIAKILGIQEIEGNVEPI